MNMSRLLPRVVLAFASFFLGSCTTIMNPYQPSFVEMAREAGASEGTKAAGRDKYAKLNFSDQLAISYANEIANILRAKFNGSRIVREVSSTAQIGIAGISGAAGPLKVGESALAVLGLGSISIPELQRIFNAKGRAENYEAGLNMIEDGINEYLALNQSPSDSVLTQNGVSLVHRATAAIHIVEQSLAGLLPTVAQMQQATERMSTAGATRTSAGTAAFNNVPANPRVESAVNHDVHGVETVSKAEFDKLKARLEAEIANRKTIVGFVEAIRKLDRDSLLTADKRKALYVAIVAEAGITTIMDPDASKLIGFFQTEATEAQKTDLTTAVIKHLSH